jgi:citrate synthase
MSPVTSKEEHRRGLDGVVAAKTRLSRIDGEKGVLRYAGYDVAELARGAGFEDVCHLLWHGRLPDAREREELRAELAGYRELPRPVLRLLASLPRETHPMTALRTGLSACGAFDPDADDASPEAALRKCKRAVVQVASLTAAWRRIRDGREPVKPDPKLSHVADFLRRVHGRKPRADQERLLEAAWVSCAEHGLNPSTFAARVAASTMTDVHGAAVAATAALQGPLHGGASQAAMELLLKAEDGAALEAALLQMIAQKAKVPGFGHRAYVGKDPRAAVCEALAEPAAKRAGETKLIELARRAEEVMRREKHLHANLELWISIVFHLLRLPADLFPSCFAAGRVAGWSAHILEQQADNRLFRPESEYHGPSDRSLAAPTNG